LDTIDIHYSFEKGLSEVVASQQTGSLIVRKIGDVGAADKTTPTPPISVPTDYF